MNKRKLILICLILLVSYCQAKLLEKAGNASLKKLQSSESDVYTGVSQKNESLQGAVDNAISHVQTQIIQSLGIPAEINIRVEDLISEGNQSTSQQMTFKKESSFSGVFAISLKAEDIYWEKHEEKNQPYYLAYVKVKFSKSAYIRSVEKEFIRQISLMESVLSDQPEANVSRIIAIKKGLNDFELANATYLPIINKDLLEEYKRIFLLFEPLWTDLCNNLSIRQINSEERFPSQVYIHVSYKTEDLRQCNIYVKSINTRVQQTNDKGMLIINPDYTRFIRQDFTLSFIPDSAVLNELPILNLTLLSPLYNENLRFKVTINSELPHEELLEEINQAFQQKGFLFQTTFQEIKNTDNAFDFSLNINVKTQYQPKLSKAGQYFYDTRLHIILKDLRTKQIIREWQYPDKEFPLIRSVGPSQLSAKSNALAMKGFSRRQELWLSLMREIEQTIKQKKY